MFVIPLLLVVVFSQTGCGQDFEDVQPLLVDTLNSLRSSILHLQKEEAELVAEKDSLRAILAGCDCDGRKPPPEPIGCRAYPPPCYPGVHCTDRPGGRVECGPCSHGFSGDGRTCTAVTTCAQRPCFENSPCYDTASGFQCGACPVGYHGNGIQCRQERPRYCDRNPCFSGVSCYETDGGYRCGLCPHGMEGDGEQCRPVRRRYCEPNPCFTGVSCQETEGGFRCGSCPRGYEGNGEKCRPERPRYCDRNPCFPGVSCHESDGGYRCDPCPRGYEGNGEQCRPERPRYCDRNPCFAGVSCHETDGGYRCGQCPFGMEGDGEQCREIRACASNPCSPGGQCYERPPQGYECVCHAGYEGDKRRCWRVKPCETQDPKPCAPGVQCRNTDIVPYYACGECTNGMTGNGIICTDINECEAEPCDPRVRCINLSPGFKCENCPPGFTGHRGFEGIGMEFARRNKQRCTDIDECLYDNGGCDKDTMRCINTEGSYKCEVCEWKETSPARRWPFNFN